MLHYPYTKGIGMKDIRIGNNLKLARVEKDLTQQELADLVGVTRQTIGLLEAGRYNPTLQLGLLLARETGKNLDELYITTARLGLSEEERKAQSLAGDLFCLRTEVKGQAENAFRG